MFYTLKVVDIKKETEDVITICFKQPGLKKVKYEAGQYLTLQFRINGRLYMRPYSFSSAPSVDAFLEVTVKRVQNGIVSNYIHDTVRVGDNIQVLPPMGNFVYKHTEVIRKVFLWGVGSGITPLISLTKEILNKFKDVKLTLVYGNRKRETSIFLDLIDELSENNPERFKATHFHTQISVLAINPFTVEGRITKQQAIRLLSDSFSDQTAHYICGPAGLKESIKEVLYDLKVPSFQIFTEDFELIRNPEDFEDICTQSIKLKYLNNEYQLEIIKGMSILESALNAGLELPYSCQTGNCSTCKAILQEGAVKMIGLTDARIDLKTNEYLLCCSHPLTSDVYLEV